MRARRWWGWPLVPVYAAGLAVRDWMRRKGWLRVRRLEWPVVSVGSLSAGGAGKTPVVIALAELLRAQGWSVDVLSRGYGRAGTGVERVNLAAQNAAGRFGDEPTLIAQKAGVPVWVGAERFAAGVAAESFAAGGGEADSSASLRNDKQESLRNNKKKVHLLDDGFQHWRLARTVEAVLVTEEDLDDALLPRGNRRERLTALARADVVVLRDEERGRVEARVRRWMREGAAIWSVRRELRVGDSLGEAKAHVQTLGFCAIARPEGFWGMLGDVGFALAEMVDFGDHHAYTIRDIDALATKAKALGATGFVTTEKDAVKLSGAMMERLREVGPVCVAGLEARFVDEADVMRGLEARCQ
ncbi:MAG: tetraacyldisaccharide 4'-kinase [Acidobacteriaceae bacterium]|nr:tetraacyldisaccharide 4'-kinase [Acidobacteriaceae bacterium]